MLHHLIENGMPEDSQNWERVLLPFYRHRHVLTTVGPVILVNERPLVPQSLRARVVDHIHAGHPGLSTMCQRLSASLYWPNYREDLMRAKLSCPTCVKIAPSNPSLPPRPPVSPQYPFQSVVCDFFVVAGNNYAALADRYSNWLSVLKLNKETSAELIVALRGYFSTFGVPEIFSSDGASIFTSFAFKDFCQRWGIQQRISSAYHPRSNKRAELAVKHAKRLVQDSLGPGGALNTDHMARALLAHRNTPDSLTGLSPAQVVFGRVLRDFLPASPGRYHPRAEWRLTADNREIAHAKRHVKTEEALSTRARHLPTLVVGDVVSVQDQMGTTPRRWSKTGTVVEVMDHDSYLVRIDGSNRLSKRNRKFLRRLSPFQCDVDEFMSPNACPDLPVQAPDQLEDVPLQRPDIVRQPQSLDRCSYEPNTPVVNNQGNVDIVMESVATPCKQPLVDRPNLTNDTVSISPTNKVPDVTQPTMDSSTEISKHHVPNPRPRVKERWVVNPKFRSIPEAPLQD